MPRIQRRKHQLTWQQKMAMSSKLCDGVINSIINYYDGAVNVFMECVARQWWITILILRLVCHCTCICACFVHHCARILQRLLEKCSSLVIEEDEDGNTPLHLAALNGWKHTAKLLLEKRANIEARCVPV